MKPYDRVGRYASMRNLPEKVLVIGAGPGGLSAAYHLARMGHAVDVYDAGTHPGGLLWTGVPDYRLPKISSMRKSAG